MITKSIGGGFGIGIHERLQRLCDVAVRIEFQETLGIEFPRIGPVSWVMVDCPWLDLDINSRRDKFTGDVLPGLANLTHDALSNGWIHS